MSVVLMGSLDFRMLRTGAGLARDACLG